MAGSGRNHAVSWKVGEGFVVRETAGPEGRRSPERHPSTLLSKGVVEAGANRFRWR